MRILLFTSTAFFLLLASFFFTAGCEKCVFVGPVHGVPTATPTPAVTATPVCVPMVPLVIQPYLDPSGDPSRQALNPLFVIRSQADWDSLYASYSPEPPVPVNFASTMILAFAQRYGDDCGDDVAITSVCYLSGHIEVHYDFRGQFKDASCQPRVCLAVVGGATTVAVQVPTSNLPVVWVKNDLCP